MTKKHKEILSRHAEICRCITRHSLKDAFERIEFWAQQCRAFGLVAQREELENTYRTLLGYAASGYADPEREKILERLMVGCFGLADDLKETALAQGGADDGYEASRIKDFLHNQSQNTAQILARLEELDSALSLSELLGEGFTTEKSEDDDTILREKTQAQLFNRWWLSGSHSADEMADLDSFLANEQASVSDKSVIISALTLNLIRHFNEQKLLLLLKMSLSPDEEIAQRALIGVIICLMRYKYRFHFYPAIQQSLTAIIEDEAAKKRLLTAIIQFIRSFDTEALTTKIRTEIFSELHKIKPLLRNKINLEEVNAADDLEDKNPEWQDLLEESGVGDKLREYSELQMEGADVFMSTFASLKHFPFFQETMNWFLPFNEQHRAVKKAVAEDERGLIKVFAKNPVMCNSDKYSFCLSLTGMQQSERNTVGKGMALESEELEKMSKEEKLLNSQKDSDLLSNQYIQDLYRFYKLYPYRADFTNPFAGNLAFYKQELLTLLGFDFDKKKQIADFYFAKNHFDKALEIYENLSAEAPTNAEIYQKIAYSYQSVGNYERALDHYLKAETINHKDSWTLKKLAFCYKMLRQYDNAFAYYEQLSEMAPDNTSHLLNIGHCLLNLGDYEEALKHYFKVEYLSPDNLNARRAVAWCEFLAQKPEQAERYYQKLIDDAPSSDDFLNAGHVQWTSGNSTAALDFYKQSVAAGSLDRFLSAFEQDRELLLQKGIAVDDMPLMLDMLRYKDSL